MTTTTRTHPRLASDVVRSWLSAGVFAAVLVVAVAVVFVLPDLVLSLGAYAFGRVAYYAAWTLFGVSYIVFTLVAFYGVDGKTLRSLTAATDPGPSRLRRAWWVFNGGGAILWTLSGAFVTLFSLIELITSRASLAPVLISASIVAVVVTVALIITSFAVTYAREDAVRGGLDFPGTPEPRFGDYVYLSIQLTTTFAGSDVEVRRRRMRRIVSTQSLIAFTFNTVVVALLVSVLVGRLG